MTSFSDDLEKRMALFMLLFLVIAQIICLVFIPANNDVMVFFDYSQQFKAGTLFDGGAFSEYPPLAWAVIILPGLFSNDFTVYFIIFSGIDVICMFLTGLMLMRICRERTRYLPILMLVYIAMTGLYFDQAIFKFDIVAVLMMTLSIDRFVSKRYCAAVAFAVIGAFIKLFPILLLPVFLIILLKDRGELERFMKGTAVVFGIALLLLAILLLSGVHSDILFGFISFQGDRGFHHESVFGTFTVIICMIFGIETTYPEAYHTLDIKNMFCDAVIGYWTFVMAAVMVLALCAIVYERSRFRDGDDKQRFIFLISSSAILMLAFIMINKVFSTQFIQWLYPLFVMMLCYRDLKQTAILSAVFIVIVLLSRAFLAISYQNMTAGQCLLFVRDILMIYALIVAFRMIHQMGCAEDNLTG